MNDKQWFLIGAAAQTGWFLGGCWFHPWPAVLFGAFCVSLNCFFYIDANHDYKYGNQILDRLEGRQKK